MIKYKLPYIGNYTDAVQLSEVERDEYINDALDYMSEHPNERFYYVGTGDTMIVVFNHDDELVVVDAKVRKQYSFYKV